MLLAVTKRRHSLDREEKPVKTAYDSCFALGRTEDEKSGLVQYL